MKRWILGTALAGLATAAIAQDMVPATPSVTAPGTVTGTVPAAPAAAPDKAAADRVAAEQREAENAREQAEDRARDQERAAEKQQKAAEKQAKEQEKAQEKANAQAAAAEKAREEQAAAAAAAATAAAAAPKGDARDVATQVCLAEAKSRAMAVGATNVTMREVEDTDKKSDGRAAVRAKVNVVTTSSKGKVKTEKKTIKCETRNGTVTKFKWD